MFKFRVMRMKVITSSKKKIKLVLEFVSLCVLTAVIVPSLLLAAAPILTGITPDTGSSTSTTDVLLTGSGFEPNAKVSLISGGPVVAGSYYTSGWALGVYVSGSYAYVADGSSGLQIMDISDPAAPILTGSYDTPGMAFDVYISGSYAYVADRASGLQIINISDPAAPTLTGSYDTPDGAFGIDVSGSYAYVADGDSGLLIINISDPYAPTLTGAYDTPGSAMDVNISGSYAYVADRYSGLQIINISDPATPTLAGSYDTPNRAVGVYVSGSYAYVADRSSGLQIINISDPAVPTLAGAYDRLGGAFGVNVSGSYAYVADVYSGLRIIDISDPAAPALAGAYYTPESAYGVYVLGSYAYVADGDSGLRIVDISDPAAPTLAGAYDTPERAYGVDVSGSYAYVVNGSSGLQIIKINTPVTNITVEDSNTITATFPAEFPAGPYHVLVTNPGGQSEEAYLYNGFRIGLYPDISTSAISGNTGVDGTQATFTVKLNSQPNGDVVIDVVSSDTSEGTVDQSVLIFNTTNWNGKQTVTVTGVDDNDACGDQDYTIQLTVNAGGTTDTTGYEALDPTDVYVTNINNETAGFSVSNINNNTGEDGKQATFTVKLNNQPAGDVVIDIVSSDTTEGTVDHSKLTFNTTNWNGLQTVTVTGSDDDMVDGDQNYTIRLTVNAVDTTGCATYDPIDISVTNIDNETAGFSVSTLSGNTGENGKQATFTVKLTSQPNGNVVIDIVSSDTTEGIVDISTLTFNSTNWNGLQKVTLTGVDDNIADSDQKYTIRLTVNAVDTTDTTGYATIDPEGLSVTNIDNETAGFNVNAISGNTGENGKQATFTVKLNSQPNGDVVIDVVSSDTTEGTVDISTLRFNSANWNGIQTVTVNGADDDIADGDQEYAIRLTVNAVDTTDTTGYAVINLADVSVINVDNDTAGFSVKSLSGDTGEDGTQATFTVKLNSQPDGDVVIDVISSDTTEGTVDQSSLTFNSSNWNSIQKVTVTGVNDDIADGDQGYTILLIVNEVRTTDTTGHAVINPADVSVINVDNDTAGFNVSAISGNTSEDGTQAIFTVKLNSQPEGDVVINIVSSDTTEGIVDISILTFDSTNWNSTQTLNIIGVDDDVLDGNKGYTIRLTVNAVGTTDIIGYAVLDPADVSVTNVDNDTAGFNVSAISGNTIEDGTQAIFTVKLNSQPKGDVVINIVSSDTTEGIVDISVLTFNSTNWNSTQTLTVIGVDDDIVDGNQGYTIRLTVNAVGTTDITGYAVLDPADVSVTNIDNDTTTFTTDTIGGGICFISAITSDSYPINNSVMALNRNIFTFLVFSLYGFAVIRRKGEQ